MYFYKPNLERKAPKDKTENVIKVVEKITLDVLISSPFIALWGLEGDPRFLALGGFVLGTKEIPPLIVKGARSLDKKLETVRRNFGGHVPIR